MLEAIQERMDALRDQDLLPVGSRGLAYATTGAEYGKDDMDALEDVILRGRRAGYIDWSEVSDGRTYIDGPYTVDDAQEVVDDIRDRIESATLDLQENQPTRVELWCEAINMAPVLARITEPYGVYVYSGSGSVPVTACRRAANRAVSTYCNEGWRPTVLLSIGDLDLHGLKSIVRPFERDVLAFAADFLKISMERGIGEPVGEDVCRVLANEAVTVRRLGVTPEQVGTIIPRGRVEKAPAKDTAQGWPWEFKVQAEAMPPEERVRLVTEALDVLLPDEGARREVRQRSDEMRAEVDRLLRGGEAP